MIKQSKVSHPHRIELKLREVSQLFNSMDPSPFNEKDLDGDAEEFIVSWAHDYPLNEPISLRIYLEQFVSPDLNVQVRESIHHYFTYRAKFSHMEFRRLLRQGRKSLLIGLVFLAFCLLITRFFLVEKEPSAWSSFLRESLTIAGWVAMWKPMQIYLYDWWPLRQLEKVYSKLGKMPVELIQRINPKVISHTEKLTNLKSPIQSN